MQYLGVLKYEIQEGEKVKLVYKAREQQITPTYSSCVVHILHLLRWVLARETGPVFHRQKRWDEGWGDKFDG